MLSVAQVERSVDDLLHQFHVLSGVAERIEPRRPFIECPYVDAGQPASTDPPTIASFDLTDGYT